VDRRLAVPQRLAEDDGELAEADLVPETDGARRVDTASVEEGAVGRPQIVYDPSLVREANFGVTPGNRRIVDEDVRRFVPADDDRLLLEVVGL
jgi:hypothetical protein